MDIVNIGKSPEPRKGKGSRTPFVDMTYMPTGAYTASVSPYREVETNITPIKVTNQLREPWQNRGSRVAGFSKPLL
jgi:hypothetical protein